jgi:hypothetical protein
MACETCKRFPTPTSNFKLIDESIDRHGTLYRCRTCGSYIEIIAEERTPKFPDLATLKRYYRNLRNSDG